MIEKKSSYLNQEGLLINILYIKKTYSIKKSLLGYEA